MQIVENQMSVVNGKPKPNGRLVVEVVQEASPTLGKLIVLVCWCLAMSTMLASGVLFVLIEVKAVGVIQEGAGAMVCLLLATIAYGVATAVDKIFRYAAG
jgi:hypothetical protein